MKTSLLFFIPVEEFKSITLFISALVDESNLSLELNNKGASFSAAKGDATNPSTIAWEPTNTTLFTGSPYKAFLSVEL